MGMRAIAAGDSLQVEADVPLPLGPVEDLVFDAMAERHDRRLRCAGAIVAIDPAARTVSVRWPMGQLTPGRWRIQLRAATPALVSTFILDDEVPVEPSLLPVRNGLLRARMAVLRVGFVAAGRGTVPVASLHLAAPRIGFTAGGTGSLAGSVARLVTPRVRMAALGTSAARGHALLSVPRPKMRAQGPGDTIRAAAVLSTLRPSMGVSGPGHAVQAVAALRLPGVRITAEGVGDVAAGVLTLSVPRPSMTVSVINMLPPAAGPSLPGYEYGPGINPGEVALTIHTPPASYGDGAIWQDGQGDITGYVTRIGDVTYIHGAQLPINRLSGGHAEGVAVPVEWWALGYEGRPGLSGVAQVLPAVSPPYSLIGLVEETSGYGLVDATTGRGLAVRGELPAWGPSVPGADVGPADEVGEVFIDIHTPPALPGSGPDDNVQNYVTRINGVTVTHNTTVLPIRRIVSGLPQGVPVEIRWWALGEQNRPGLIGVASVYPRPADVAETIGLIDVTTGHGLVDQTTGHGLVLSVED